MEELNPKQLQFVLRYLETGNATRSYMEAYAEEDEAQAAANASRLIRNDKVSEVIENCRKKAMASTQVTVERVLLELSRIGFSDISRIVEYDEAGMRIKPFNQLSGEDTAVISEITETPSEHGTRRSIKLHSKLTALAMMTRYLGMDVQRLKVDAGSGLVVNVYPIKPEDPTDAEG